MAKTVLWVSRHKLLPIQVKELARLLGDFKLLIFSRKVPSVEWLIDNVIRPSHVDIVIPVLPLTMMARLAELGEKHGFEVWYSEMEAVKLMPEKPQPGRDYDPEREAVLPANGSGYRIMRFKGFHRLRRVELKLEPLEPK